MRQVHIHAVAVVGHEGATWTTLLPPWGQHEVLDQQLAATVKQFGERARTLRCFEHVILVDPHPWQRAPLAGDLIAQACQFLFVHQQRLALGYPFIPGDDAMTVADTNLGSTGRGGVACFHRFWLLAWVIHSLSTWLV